MVASVRFEDAEYGLYAAGDGKLCGGLLRVGQVGDNSEAAMNDIYNVRVQSEGLQYTWNHA